MDRVFGANFLMLLIRMRIFTDNPLLTVTILSMRRTTEMQALYMTVNCKMFHVLLLQFAKCIVML